MASSIISGIGSGVDTVGIVKALVDAEKAPKQKQINTLTATTSTTLSAVGSIQSALEAYRTALAAMNKPENYTGLVGSSSKDTVAKMTVSAGASTGNYELHVDNLATASKISSKVFTGGPTAIVNNSADPSSLIIEQSGKAHNVSIPAGATLQETRDAINSQLASTGISANVLTDSNGSRLILSSSVTGKDTDLVVKGNSGLETGTTVVTKPQNASYTIDNIAMVSSTNTIAAAVSGVSVQLVGTGDSTISVVSSDDALKTSVKGFVDAYNTLMTAINATTKVSVAVDGSTSGGGLTGDASVRSLVSSIRNELVTPSGSGVSKTLSEFGISTAQKTGLLEFDEKKWTKALASNGSSLAGIMTGKDGLISRMTKATESFALSKTGVFASRTAALSQTLEDLTTQQATLDSRMASLSDTLTKKYTAMDTLVAKLKATSSSIMTTLNALNKVGSD